MVSIKNVLMPFRMSLREKSPVTLRLELTNDDSETKLFSLKLMVSKHLSIEKTGIANILDKRIGEIKPKETKLFYFDIYPKVSAKPGIDYPARLIVYEHYNDYEFINKELKKDFTVKVVE